jgi:hypothetical protein
MVDDLKNEHLNNYYKKRNSNSRAVTFTFCFPKALLIGIDL